MESAQVCNLFNIGYIALYVLSSKAQYRKTVGIEK